MFALLLLACAGAPKPPVVASTGQAVSAPMREELGEGLSSELVVAGALRERLSQAPADLVLLYGGEEKGSLEPCGCPTRPRGGLARQAAYADALRAHSPALPVLQVNGGYWLEDAMGLDGQPRPDIPTLNRWMVAGMQRLGPAALNVGYNDMAGLTSIGGAPAGLPLVSANVTGPGVSPYRIVSAGALRVGITGVTTAGLTFLETPGFTVADPVRAGRAVLAELAPQVDLVVLLAYAQPEAARALARTGLVDVVVDTNLHRERYAPLRVDGAVWVRSHYQTMRLGELRLVVDADGTITAATDRKIDLDPTVPDADGTEALLAESKAEIRARQREVFGKGR